MVLAFMVALLVIISSVFIIFLMVFISMFFLLMNSISFVVFLLVWISLGWSFINFCCIIFIYSYSKNLVLKKFEYLVNF